MSNTTSSRPRRRRSYSATGSRRNGRAGGRPQRHTRGGGRGKRVQPTFNPSQFINTTPVAVEEVVYKPKHTFGSFGLDKRVTTVLSKNGIDTPSPIQDQIIPEILAGHDVIGLAETGTGKTAAFLLPLITKTLAEYRRQTLILTPTRELAIQIEQELKKFTMNARLYFTTCVGGTPIGPQIGRLKRKNHFVIGTPGRIKDLIERGAFRTDQVSTVVLDEADRMLDMGFIHDMRSILSTTPAQRETLFFSATMSPTIEKLVHEFLRDPVTVSVKKTDVTNSIKQDVVRYEAHHKYDTLLTLLSKSAAKRVIIFGAMKHGVQKLADQLNTDGIKAQAIHGNKSHGQRQQALRAFKSGNAQVLVATDVAARGIHVDKVSHVINYDMPATFEDYVHRIGRTGRGSEQGEALTFVPA